MAAFKVHKCRFVEWDSAAITASAFSNSCKYLAISRANGTMEIWNVEHEWFLQNIFPGEGPEFSTRSLVWVPSFDHEKGIEKRSDHNSERLFSAGLAGEITEWDLSSLKPKEKTIVGAGGMWQMVGLLSRFTDSDGENQWQYRLCVGCEDGRVRIYRVSDSGSCVLLSTSLRQPSRVLCVAWHSSGKLVCSGDADGTIRVFEADNCKQKYRMTTSTNDTPTRIWAILYLNNHTIVSGNSLGNTEFWDSKIGVQLQSLSTHTHDITSIVVTADHETLVSAGINGRLIRLKATANRWVISARMRSHTHDVNTLALATNGKDWVVSGGLDRMIIRQTLALEPELPGTETFKMDPIPHFPVYSSCNSPQAMMLTHCGTQIQLWALGKSSESYLKEHGVHNYKELSIDEPVRHLVHLDLKTELSVYCSAISPQGTFIAASDTNRLFVFALYVEELNKISLKKVSLPAVPRKGIIRVAFTSNQLVMATNRGSIFVVDLRSKEIHEFEQHKSENRGSIHSLIVSEDGQWLVSADTSNQINVYNLDVMKHYDTLPSFPYPVTALRFSPIEAVITIACSNSFLYQYNVENHDLTDWSKKHSDKLPTHFLAERGIITNITFNPADPTVCFLSSTNFLCKVDFKKHVDQSRMSPSTSGRKRRRRGSQDDSVPVPTVEKLPSNFAIIRNYSPILFANFVGQNELVVVERPRAEYVKDLPAPVFTTRHFQPSKKQMMKNTR